MLLPSDQRDAHALRAYLLWLVSVYGDQNHDSTGADHDGGSVTQVGDHLNPPTNSRFHLFFFFGRRSCPVCRAVIPGWDGKGGGVIGLSMRVVLSL